MPNVKLPFTDIKSFVEDGTYKIGSTNGLEDMFEVFCNIFKEIHFKSGRNIVRYLIQEIKMSRTYI